MDALRAEVGERSRRQVDPGRSIVATSFGGHVGPVAAGTVILDAVYASPLRRAVRSQAC
jgi:hypothetical protein